MSEEKKMECSCVCWKNKMKCLSLSKIFKKKEKNENLSDFPNTKLDELDDIKAQFFYQEAKTCNDKLIENLADERNRAFSLIRVIFLFFGVLIGIATIIADKGNIISIIKTTSNDFISTIKMTGNDLIDVIEMTNTDLISAIKTTNNDLIDVIETTNTDLIDSIETTNSILGDNTETPVVKDKEPNERSLISIIKGIFLFISFILCIALPFIFFAFIPKESPKCHIAPNQFLEGEDYKKDMRIINIKGIKLLQENIEHNKKLLIEHYSLMKSSRFFIICVIVFVAVVLLILFAKGV